MPNLKRFLLNEQPWTWKVKTVIWTCQKLSLGGVKKYYLVYLALMLSVDVELKVIPFLFQDLVEDFVFPASKLIVEARNGSGTCGLLKTFHVVQVIKGKNFLCVVYLHVFFFWLLNVIWKARKRENSSDKVIVQRPQNECNNSNLLVLELFMFIPSSIIGEGNHSSSSKEH